MPLKNGFEATQDIRVLEDKRDLIPTLPSQVLNGRIPVVAVSASLEEGQREYLQNTVRMDGWCLKPIKIENMRAILRGIYDLEARNTRLWAPGINWELGGWLHYPTRE